MVKSKKMSKTSIAVIVLALLLVLSLVMGMTGAWFTDSNNSGTDNVSFGTINISGESVAAAIYRHDGSTVADANNGGAELMPGDVLKFSGVLANNGQMAYVMAKVTYTVKNASDVDYSLTSEEEALITLGAITGTKADEQTAYSWTDLTGGKYTIVDEGEEINYLLTVNVDDAVANKFQGYKIIVAVEFYAVQYANFSTSDLQAAFNAATVSGFARTTLTAYVAE